MHSICNGDKQTELETEFPGEEIYKMSSRLVLTEFCKC